MLIVTATEFQQKIGYYEDRALIEPIMVTEGGCERVVLLSVEAFNRLKKCDFQTSTDKETK